ncbi:MAG: hypothetical protein NZT92_10265 [Abditibacteriales bacterium]|nr:hypothetical protein [Abditibacteriales bacterium]
MPVMVSGAKPSTRGGDCFVAALLAMTPAPAVMASEAKPSPPPEMASLRSQ